MKKLISAILSLTMCITPVTAATMTSTAADTTAVTAAEKETKHCEMCGAELPDDALPSPLGIYVCSDCRKSGAGGTTVPTHTETTTTSPSVEIFFHDELALHGNDTKEFSYSVIGVSDASQIQFTSSDDYHIKLSNKFENGEGTLTITSEHCPSGMLTLYCTFITGNDYSYTEGVPLEIMFKCPKCGNIVHDEDVAKTASGHDVCMDCYNNGAYVGTTTTSYTTTTVTTTTLPDVSYPNGNCGDNLTWVLKDGVLRISGSGDMDDFVFGAPFKDLEVSKVIIPDGVTSIGINTFAACKDITGVTLPDSVKSIGDWAFYGCDSLRSITIPESVTKIGKEVFMNCPDLTISGIAGSYAETYAKANSIPFKAVSSTATTTATTTTTTTTSVTETTTSYIRSTPIGFISHDSLPDEVVMQSGEEMTLNFMGMYIIGVKAVSSDETIVKAAAELGSGVFTQTGTVTLNAVKTDKTKTAEVEFFYETFVPQDGGSKVIKVTVAGEKDAPVESTDQAFVNVSYVKFPAGSKSPIHLRNYLAQNIRFTSDCEYISFERNGFNTPGIVQTSDDPSVIIVEDEYTKAPTSGNMYVIVDENAPTCTAEVTMTYTSLSTNKDVTKKFKIDILSKEDAAQTTTTTSSVITTTTTTQPSTDALDRVGDSNCDGQCNMADAVFIMQCIANPDKYQLTERGRAQADVDRSGDITNKDALVIQKYKLHLIDKLN